MSNELNITSGDIAENAAETSAGESTGGTDGNKIVPIANKTGTTVADNTAAVSTPTEPISQPASDHSAPVPTADTDTTAAAAQIPPTPAPAVSAASAPVEPVSAPTPSAASSSEAPSAARIQGPDTGSRHSSRSSSHRDDADNGFDFDEDERPRKRFFRSRREEESRDALILSRIRDEDLMEYLTLEQRRVEFLQQAKETREKRLLMAFQLLISLAAIVAVTYLLKDNPTILISILYIVGIIAALIIWKNPRDKGKGRHS